MASKNYVFFILFFFLCYTSLIAQEWKTIKAYQKETGNEILQEGCWLKKDRIKNTDHWKKANEYNISIEKGFEKYVTISQFRDFYNWFAIEIEKQGHEVKWIRVSHLVAMQLSKLECGFIRFFIIRNSEVIDFANNGSKRVFEFAYGKMRGLYFSNQIYTGGDALEWDDAYGSKEQCIVLKPLYKELSEKALKKLDRMAKGKGIYAFGIDKNLRFKGDIKDCISRYQYGNNIISKLNENKKLQ